jgi:5-oxoprolinase (ATP-hydrolysing)
MLNSNIWFDFSIDRGGTFTDIFCQVTNDETKEQETVVMKLLSVDPSNYQDAPTEGIRRVMNQKGTDGKQILER